MDRRRANGIPTMVILKSEPTELYYNSSRECSPSSSEAENMADFELC